jgi:HlyD family secretion protein
MPLSKRLFRESALERLSSPEQLDQQLQVTSPRGWIALLALWSVLAAIMVWSFVGSVPTREEGRGIIVTGGGLRVVVSPGKGRLRSIDVEVGDTLDPGDIIGAISQQTLQDELEEATSQLVELQAQNRRHVEFDQREEYLQASLASVEEQRLTQSIKYASDRITRLRVRHDIVTDLFEQGMMTAIDLHEIEQDIETVSLEQEKARLEIQQLIARNENNAFQRERERMKRDNEVDLLQSKVDLLAGRLKRESQVVCQVAGRVVEIRAAIQTEVDVGDAIVLIEPTGSESGTLEAILYVSAATGKRIKVSGEVDGPDMVAHISPSTVKREEFGSMLGVVSFVAKVPTSKPAMEARLGDKDLAEKLTQEIGLPLEVRISLIPSNDTPSGYAWTSSHGPETVITAGTLCRGSVTVSEQRPIELLIPFLKKRLGLD